MANSNVSNGTGATDSLTARARSLVQRAAASFNADYGFSTTSCQIYDTAWVAMIVKTIEGQKQWLFPDSLDFILKSQNEDGSWGTHQATQTASILDTAAALLALLRHAAEPLQIQGNTHDDLRGHIERASCSLKQQLSEWNDLLTTNHIGVELILPALFDYLKEEDENLVFSFKGKSLLEDMNRDKLARFSVDSLYSKKLSSTIHSLEAFVGKIDFDKVAHHLYQGSMMASPSSTAAYLMHASQWDDRAEAYLRHVSKTGAGNGTGGIPGTFPTTYFEYSWILTTLLRGSFTRIELGGSALNSMADVLVKGFEEDHGIIGFAPRAVDVDDTAKGLLALSLFDQTIHISPETMIRVFEAKDHFTTFGSERDPSFTSNCHVLLALLHQSDVSQYSSQILKCVRFLVKCWWNNDGNIKDKWHLSHLYPTMLMIEAFTDLTRVIDEGTMPDLLDSELQIKVLICLYQACLRTLLQQNENGSWNGLPEQTSYAILALAEARHLYFFAALQAPLQTAVFRGAAFLASGNFLSHDHNWTSKTAYRVTLVAEAYMLAAMNICCHSSAPTGVGFRLAVDVSKRKIDGLLQLVRQTQLFSDLPEWQVRASLQESVLFAPLLKAQRNEIFERDATKLSEDTYLDIIPFTWIGCNNRSNTTASSSYLFDMMMISMLGYQIDEFIEAVAGPAFVENKIQLHRLVDDIINRVDYAIDGNGEAHKEGTNTTTNSLEDHIPSLNGHCQTHIETQVSDALSRFVRWVLHHSHVLNASTWDRSSLKSELKAFMHAHIVQLEDNSYFGTQSDHSTYVSPQRPFFQWVRSTAADHVACAYSLAFSNCLLSATLNGGKEVFPTVTEKYLAAAAARHLTTMCRMYNDYGSLARDSAERNVNSMHYPEFKTCVDLREKKDALAKIARYEHSCLRSTLIELDRDVTAGPTSDFAARKMDMLKFYCDVTDFYDQLYVIRDLSSIMKQK